jgi:hypothetical protein
MKKLMVPVIVSAFALFIAYYFFGVDVEGLTEGFIDFLTDLLDGPG